MLLTAEEIINEQIITTLINPACVQQVGIDLEVEKLFAVQGGGGVFAEQKTQLPTSIEIEPIENSSDPLSRILGAENKKGWVLLPGYYEVMFRQGCKLKNNRTMRLKQRSSLGRCGSYIISGLYDPGFQTENIGAYMRVELPIFIEYHARLCQAYVIKSKSVSAEYNGQFQADNQRK